MKPAIGITSDIQTVTNGRGVREERYFLKKAMADAVAEAGGVPLVLPFCVSTRQAARTVAGLDGLLISGGDFDITPSIYGERRIPQCGPSIPARTRSELLLLTEAEKSGLPILGICGGCQLINVHFGGTLHQDIPTEKTGALRHSQKEAHARATHEATVAPDTLLRKMTGAKKLKVNSTHHQAVKAPGRGMVVSAVAPDGIIEGIEAADGRWIAGVQWHPEFLTRIGAHRGIFKALVAAAGKRARATAR